MINYARLTTIVCALFGALILNAQESAPLNVGVREAPPFSFQDADGRWSGIAIELWESIAETNQLDYNYSVRELSDLLASLEAGTTDVAVGALTITAERERRFDFTHPFMDSGLAIAAEQTPAGLWFMVKRFVSLEFLQALVALTTVILAFGFLIWWFERKKNEQFGGSTIEGVGSGFWWSAVTMTTVGYGDKSPVTLGGRIVGLVWMFAAIIIISGFTAAIASSLTVGSLQSSIQGMEDLYDAKVGVIASSSAAGFLESAEIDYKGYRSLSDLLDALEEGRVDAVVHDAPILQYQINQREMTDFKLLTDVLDPQDYGFGLRPGMELREAFNRSLLEMTQSKQWDNVKQRYLQAN